MKELTIANERLERVIREFCDVCEIMGKDPEDAAAGALEQILSPLRGPDGKIDAMPAVYSDYNGDTHACYVFGETSVFGQPYYVVLGKNLYPMKVPVNCVTFE